MYYYSSTITITTTTREMPANLPYSCLRDPSAVVSLPIREDFMLTVPGEVANEDETFHERRQLLDKLSETSEKEEGFTTMEVNRENPCSIVINPAIGGETLDNTGDQQHINSQTRSEVGNETDQDLTSVVISETPSLGSLRDTSAPSESLKPVARSADPVMETIRDEIMPGNSKDHLKLIVENSYPAKKKSACLPITSEDGTECLIDLAATGDSEQFIQIQEGDKVVMYKKMQNVPRVYEGNNLTTDTGQDEKNIGLLMIGVTQTIDPIPSGMSTPMQENPDDNDKKQAINEDDLLQRLQEANQPLLDRLELLTATVESLKEIPNKEKPKKTKRQKIMYYGKRITAVSSFLYALYNGGRQLIEMISEWAA